MIFLSLEIRFKTIEETICVYQESDEDDICGEATSRGMMMPFDIPAMPLCFIHAYKFRDWTRNDTLREFIEVMTEEESIRELEDMINDDSEE